MLKRGSAAIVSTGATVLPVGKLALLDTSTRGEALHAFYLTHGDGTLHADENQVLTANFNVERVGNAMRESSYGFPMADFETPETPSMLRVTRHVEGGIESSCVSHVCGASPPDKRCSPNLSSVETNAQAPEKRPSSNVLLPGRGCRYRACYHRHAGSERLNKLEFEVEANVIDNA